MDCEIGQITVYLSKPNKKYNDVIHNDKIRESDTESFKVRSFRVDGIDCVFYCQQVFNVQDDVPPWIEFINENLTVDDAINFKQKSERPSGLLLINRNDRVYAASFGTRGASWLNKKEMEPDFGIIVAMNLCGNNEVRQAKSAIQSYTTQMIDRQQSKPSDTFEFGMSDIELLKFISAHLQEDKNITLQGKDCLTLKVIGEKKLSWKRLISFIDEFYDSYHSESYKELFPNYPNLSPVDDITIEKLDDKLVSDLVSKNLGRIHLAIPEFISDDQYSFSYSCNQKRENRIFSHIRIEDLYKETFKKIEDITLASLQKKYIYAYSHEHDRILDYKRWDVYSCIVSEVKLDDDYFVLSLGEWKKVDRDFYKTIEDFVSNDLLELELDTEYQNINIACIKSMQNREEIFNEMYCKLNPQAIAFDQAKLRIGKAKKDKEFCDILERTDNEISIIQVKKHSGCSSINYLFSQTRFYCEFFLTDNVFISNVREYISSQDKICKNGFLDYIKPNVEDVLGPDYSVKMWLLYDAANEKPNRNDLPLMAKYELKLTHDKLRKTLKFKQVSLSMVPVKMTRFTQAKKPERLNN
ncbi:DUF6119 family protein [Aeromonas caviae]|uniref:DUF6119 family protein n=1 Tax=Aeromonas caviae TaxID=648 RepID=UPI001BCFC086|nr:DUF6119 family protein [Aeromonas caviae]MBS4712383.1 TIGR04141 family sporadically distributed protein [Aeromonas caviae]